MFLNARPNPGGYSPCKMLNGFGSFVDLFECRGGAAAQLRRANRGPVHVARFVNPRLTRLKGGRPPQPSPFLRFGSSTCALQALLQELLISLYFTLQLSHHSFGIILLKLPSNPFKWRHSEPTIILLCVRWHCRYPLSYRDLEEMMRERGLDVDHSTVFRWVRRYAPEINKRMRQHLRVSGTSHRVDETYILRREDV